MKRLATIGGLVLPVLLMTLAGGCRRPGRELALGGGPTGGTFQNIASGLARLISHELPEVRVWAKHTGGSIDNLKQVERGKLPMALVYAGDAYLGSRGKLNRDEPATVNVRAIARLYGAAAQLVVLNSNPARAPNDLRQMRIAIGNPGSGSALAALRYFHGIGILEDIIPVYVGFDMGLEELRQRSVDGVWLMVGFPNLSLRKFAANVPIRLLDLHDAAVAADFFTSHPYYTMARIPAGTYPGQERDVTTFQDAAIWVANSQVADAFVYQALQLLFSAKGLAEMRAADPAAADMSAAKGVLGVTIPLHPGAERFWREQGALRPSGSPALVPPRR